jgi:predicted transcriptional regulator
VETIKSITMSEEMAACIQELADKDRRSFSREAQVLLETALNRKKQAEAEVSNA